MSKEYAVEVKNLYKSFKLPTEKSTNLKQTFVNWTKGVKGYEEQKVLKGISFNIEKGDFFGIVGRNGSGKSTLLKLLAGIYEPDKGTIGVDGTLVPFIELGVGFNPELTGRENVYMNGALLGFSTKEVESMYEEIVEFAELHDFMNQKLKNYSSGMQVRLAFSIAIRAKSDILVLDEVLAVGDEAFQRKCNDFFAKIKKDKARTVILVTHSMDSVRKYCNKAMMIRDGDIIVNGSPEDVANEYSLENFNVTSDDKDGNANEDTIIKDFKIKLLSAKQINQDEEVRIKVSYRTSEPISTKVAISLKDIDRNTPIIAAASPVIDKQSVSLTLTVALPLINDTNIKIETSVRDQDGNIIHYPPDSIVPLFAIRRTDYPNPKERNTWAMFFDRGKWKEM